MSDHDDKVYLLHMRDHAQEALAIMSDSTQEDILSDRIKLLALCKLLEIVGEAANRVSPETKSRLQYLPWRGMISMRNRIIHGYESISIQKIWETIKNDLPTLVESLDAILDAEPEEDV